LGTLDMPDGTVQSGSGGDGMASEAGSLGGSRAQWPDAPALVGIDIGTSSVRAIAFDERGRRLAAAARPTPTRIVETGGEFDSEAMFSTVLAALAEVGAALAGRPVAGIAVASFG